MIRILTQLTFESSLILTMTFHSIGTWVTTNQDRVGSRTVPSISWVELLPSRDSLNILLLPPVQISSRNRRPTMATLCQTITFLPLLLWVTLTLTVTLILTILIITGRRLFLCMALHLGRRRCINLPARHHPTTGIRPQARLAPCHL